jgi:hypothetical protein
LSDRTIQPQHGIDQLFHRVTSDTRKLFIPTANCVHSRAKVHESSKSVTDDERVKSPPTVGSAGTDACCQTGCMFSFKGREVTVLANLSDDFLESPLRQRRRRLVPYRIFESFAAECLGIPLIETTPQNGHRGETIPRLICWVVRSPTTW